MHENKFDKIFKGHRDHIVSLDISPVDDTFCSGGLDDAIRIWDLRTQSPCAMFKVKGHPCVSFDPFGKVVAVASAINCIRLYDVRQTDKGPFDGFVYDGSPMDFTGLKMGSRGKFLLASTPEMVIVLDAMKLTKIQEFTDFTGNEAAGGSVTNFEACFTADEEYLMSGSDDGSIHIWEVDSGKKIQTFSQVHAGPVGCLKFNPAYLMFASCCQNVLFWTSTEKLIAQ